MIQGRSTGRLKQLTLGGALAALLAFSAIAGGAAGDPGQRGHDTQTALNFTKIEYQTGANVSPQDFHVTTGADQALNFAKIEF